MILYLDTSSLVKLYTEEEGSSDVANLVRSSKLRGFDAIHLSSAVTLHKELDTPIIFSCFDEKLEAASQLEELDQPE
jgi:PIN domain nuclease of toxin-antitoxin system